MMTPDAQLAATDHHSDLSADQQAKIKPILDADAKKIADIRSSGEDMLTCTPEDDGDPHGRARRDQGLLTADQAAKYDAMPQGRGPGGGGGATTATSSTGTCTVIAARIRQTGRRAGRLSGLSAWRDAARDARLAAVTLPREDQDRLSIQQTRRRCLSAQLIRPRYNGYNVWSDRASLRCDAI